MTSRESQNMPELTELKGCLTIVGRVSDLFPNNFWKTAVPLFASLFIEVGPYLKNDFFIFCPTSMAYLPIRRPTGFVNSISFYYLRNILSLYWCFIKNTVGILRKINLKVYVRRCYAVFLKSWWVQSDYGQVSMEFLRTRHTTWCYVGTTLGCWDTSEHAWRNWRTGLTVHECTLK